MPESTLILYTQNLLGQIDMLPRLFTFLREVRKKYAAEKTILLDLGDACSAEAWHCGATEGRSMLIVLDAMGYQAANVNGYLSDEGRTKLTGVIAMTLLNESQSFVDENGLGILVAASDKTELRNDGTLSLVKVMAGQVGVVLLEQGITTNEVLMMPAKTAPEPTIAGVVDFVLSEAKYYGRKKGE
jgi:hypothetical protein